MTGTVEPRRRGRHRREPGLAALRLAAAVCTAAGLGLLAYTGYRIWDPGALAAQHRMMARLHTLWHHPHAPGPAARAAPGPVRVRPGQPFAIIRIPAFGPRWRFAVVEGTSPRQLADGPGHVRGTALPGAPGNFAVAAHDITAGNPFLHLASLRRGDPVIVQVAGGTYRYAVTSETVARYTDTAFLAPVPGRPGVRPTTQSITLITCTPVTLDFTPWRIVVTGRLVRSTPGPASPHSIPALRAG